MEGDRKDTGGAVTLAKAYFTNEETKAQMGNTRSIFASTVWAEHVCNKYPEGMMPVHHISLRSIMKLIIFKNPDN